MEKGTQLVVHTDLRTPGSAEHLASRLPYNPDRDRCCPAARLTQRGVTGCRRLSSRRTTNPYGEIPEDDSGRRDEWTA
jgi:hypothetical protein